MINETYIWPEDCHKLLTIIKEDTVENRLAMWEEFAKAFETEARGKVIFMRLPPKITSDTEFYDEIKMARIDCRFSIAERAGADNGA